MLLTIIFSKILVKSLIFFISLLSKVLIEKYTLDMRLCAYVLLCPFMRAFQQNRKIQNVVACQYGVKPACRQVFFAQQAHIAECIQKRFDLSFVFAEKYGTGAVK